MRVAVTGAGGFIGARAVAALERSQHDPVAIVRRGSFRDRLLACAPDARVVELDLEDEPGATRSLHTLRPDAILHLAWYAHPRDYLRAHENIESLHTTLRLARAAFAAGCGRFVGVGSCAEYADSSAPRVEPSALGPTSLYAACKVGAFHATAALAREQGASFAWARVFHLHGPGEHPQRLVPTAAAALRAGRSIDLSPGEQVRDHLHVDDVARALASITTANLEGPVNVCSGEGVTLRRLLETVGDLFGRRDLLRFGALPYREGESMFVVGDATRLASIGFAPRFVRLEDGLRDALLPPQRS
jgi:dTDP-6-deoxy-L-talose 4-dehydrogenase (NAD+)